MSVCLSMLIFRTAQCSSESVLIQDHIQNMGAQWLSGRKLDSRLRGRVFELHKRHCIVSFSKNINPSLVLVQPRKTCPFITERLLMGRKESNQTKYSEQHSVLIQDHIRNSTVFIWVWTYPRSHIKNSTVFIWVCAYLGLYSEQHSVYQSVCEGSYSEQHSVRQSVSLSWIISQTEQCSTQSYSEHQSVQIHVVCTTQSNSEQHIVQSACWPDHIQNSKFSIYGYH